jgi:hypothetical protein
MVADLMLAEKPAAQDLLARLSETAIFATDAMPNVSAAVNDPDRLRSLHDTGLLDSPPEKNSTGSPAPPPMRSTRHTRDVLDRCRPPISQEYGRHGW